MKSLLLEFQELQFDNYSQYDKNLAQLCLSPTKVSISLLSFIFICILSIEYRLQKSPKNIRRSV